MKDSTKSKRPINGQVISGEFYSCFKEGIIALKEGIAFSSSSSASSNVSGGSESSDSSEQD